MDNHVEPAAAQSSTRGSISRRRMLATSVSASMPGRVGTATSKSDIGDVKPHVNFTLEGKSAFVTGAARATARAELSHPEKDNPCFGRRFATLSHHIPPEPSGEGREAAGAILRLLHFMALKTNVYVDAFNLYYGCLRKTPYRWLDLAKLCAKILPRNEIHKIRYFTALVTPRPSDPQQRNRQEIYIRALRTLPNLSVHTGRYLASKVRMMRADGFGTVEVLKSEEKGSDVNLASYLLIDAYRSDCDVSVIVSNDSDLVFPIEHIKQQVGKVIGILNPRPRPSRELFPLANFYRQIRPSVLADSQFPETLTDAQGEFHKPLAW